MCDRLGGWPLVCGFFGEMPQLSNVQMIADHARSCGLIIVANNLREFDHGPGLRIEDWVTQRK